MNSQLAMQASSALNWASRDDRRVIADNLCVFVAVLEGELAVAEGRQRLHLLHDLHRVNARLVVCNLDAARFAKRCFEAEMQKQTICRITLEEMADMLEQPCDGRAMAMAYLELGQKSARFIRDEKLGDWFGTGPYSALGRLALTVAELDIEKAETEREAFSELIRMARWIPLGQGVDEEKIESQIFRDGLTLFRRHQGLEKYPFGK